MAGEKRSDVEVKAIVSQICFMMINGITRRDEIFKHIEEMDALSIEKQKAVNWVTVGDKSERMIDIYISHAKDLFLEAGAEKRESVRALYIAQLENLFQRAIKENKLQTANAIMKNKMYLQGLGGFNVSGLFSIKNFDVQLTPEEEAEYQKRLNVIYGESFINDFLNKKK